MTRFIFKLFLLLINILFNNSIVFAFVGLINKRLKIISSVFVAYPAAQEYLDAYYFPWYSKRIGWKPSLAGIINQDNKFGLMMGISITDSEFKDEENKEKLKKFAKSVDKIRMLLNAKQMNFAGILPGVLFMNRIVSETPEADVTVDAVLNAEKKVREIEGYPSNTPLIILGGKGFIGRRLIKKINDTAYRKVYEVDLNGHDGANKNAWPKELIGKKAILINVTTKNVLSNYIPHFWKELILLNEVYPEPSETEVFMMISNRVIGYHVVGVKANAYPPFPRAYKGGVPCCAAVRSKTLDSIIKRIT